MLEQKSYLLRNGIVGSVTGTMTFLTKEQIERDNYLFLSAFRILKDTNKSEEKNK